MPRNEPCPRFALHAGLDPREWSGVSILTNSGGTVTLPDYGADVFPDVLSFLTGLASGKTAGAVYTVGIDTDDRVYVEAAASFTITGPAEWGFTSTTAAVLDGVWRATAPSDWARGNLDTGGVVVQSVGVLLSGRFQDVPTAIRDYSTTYPDTPSYDSLAELDETADANDYVTWGISAEGYVWRWYADTSTTLVWLSTTLRDRLGFSGDEVPVSHLGGTLWTADYPCPGCWHPTRPAQSLDLASETFAESRSQTDGEMASNYVATHHRWTVSGYVDGPVDTKDDHLHLHRSVLPYFHAGAPCTLYQDCGDGRAYTWRGDYSLTYTAERVGCATSDPQYRGRIVGYMYEGFDRVETTWPQMLRRRSPITLVIQDVPFDGQWEGTE